MSKKKLPVTSLVNELHDASAFFSSPPVPQPTPKNAVSPIQKPTSNSTQKRDTQREPSSDNPRENSRSLPTRDEVQEFSFRLRDEIKVKVQAEVPHHWQRELEDLARELDVKKLELYRFMIGEFLGKVKRKSAA